MIGALLIAAVMGGAAIWVALMVSGLRTAPPLGWSLGSWMGICLALVALGVVLLRMGI